MSDTVKITTSQYNTQGKVDIDGHIWDVKLPGAGTELRLSQAFRASKLYSSRIQLLDKKIDDETITDADLDRYEEYNKKYEESEKMIFSFFTGVFRDSTPDNAEVKQWVEDTPTAVIEMAFNDVKEQANSKETDGSKEPETS